MSKRVDRTLVALDSKLDAILSGPVWRIYQDERKQAAFLGERSVELWLLRRPDVQVVIDHDVPDQRSATGYRTIKQYTREEWLAAFRLMATP